MKKPFPATNTIVELLGLSVLFAAAETHLVSHVSKILTPFCGRLYTANSGKYAIDLFRKNIPDLVLTDISLPGVSGLEVTRQIKQMRPAVPVIIITAENDAEQLMQAIDLNVDGYLTKPISPSLLREQIKHFLSVPVKARTGQ